MVENNKALGSTSGILSIGESGALNLNGYSMTVGALSGAGILYSDNGKGYTPVTLTTNTAANSTFSGTIYGYGVTLVKAGTGTLTLASDGAGAAGISLLAGGLNLNDKDVFGNAAAFTIGGAGVIDNTVDRLSRSRPERSIGTLTLPSKAPTTLTLPPPVSS